MNNEAKIAAKGVSRFSHIDAVRAFAVMLVVVSHADLGAYVPGGAGVTIFFTISGFIITFVLLRERDREGAFSISRFYLKRVLKLLPPLILIIVIPSVIYSLFARIDWFAVMGQIFFFYNWLRIYADVDVLPGSGITWSLAIEEQFYICFALIWLCFVRFRHSLAILQVASLLVIAWALVARIALAGAALPNRIEFGTDTRLDSIAIGILCAIAYSGISGNRRRRSKAFRHSVRLNHSLVPVLAGAVFLTATAIQNEFFSETFKYTLQSAAVGLLLLYGMSKPSGIVGRAYLSVCDLRVVQIIGLASYSIYLIHVPIYRLIVYVLPDLDARISIPLRITLATAAGVLVWKLVETPIERFKTKSLSPKNPTIVGDARLVANATRL
ncbi:acyltransferase family protein [Arthrobacter cavernae]|uniref:Acyltransferase n=1 Tax=Arthrobacter cavernae TaxID=2817681 RepID=A0A939HEH9_9MICC|nr:acyltransferase [Arthrobacter cavernae]MBO1267724.1 acyltransferase [Arthrobacter cavernae]